MKATFSILVAIAAACSGHAQEERRSGAGVEVLPSEQKGPGSDLTNDEALAALREKSGTMKVQRFRPQGNSLAELSQFVGQDDQSVILPKGSVIHCPPAMAARVLAKPQCTVIPWSDFLVAHRGWIATREVTLAQVRGQVPIAEADRTSFNAAGKMVIATFRGNPVTILSSPPTPEKP